MRKRFRKIIEVTDPDETQSMSENDITQEIKADSSDGEGVGPAQVSLEDVGADSVASESGLVELVDKLKSEAEESYDKYIRAVAELENVKKRAIKERADILKYAGEGLARDLLEVVDNLHLAISKEMPGVNEELLKGVRLVFEQFEGILERHQIKGESGLGKPFDPLKQEALASVPTDDHPPGTVIEEFKRHFTFKDKLLRPGQVVVAAQKPNADLASEGEDG